MILTCRKDSNWHLMHMTWHIRWEFDEQREMCPTRAFVFQLLTPNFGMTKTAFCRPSLQILSSRPLESKFGSRYSCLPGVLEDLFGRQMLGLENPERQCSVSKEFRKIRISVVTQIGISDSLHLAAWSHFRPNANPCDEANCSLLAFSLVLQEFQLFWDLRPRIHRLSFSRP